jgi:hypothetical protein
VLWQCLVTVGDALLYVWEYQAVQESPGTVELRVVPTTRYTKAVDEFFRRELETLLGPGTRVRVATVDSIERTPSGERLAIMFRIPRTPTAAGSRVGEPS